MTQHIVFLLLGLGSGAVFGALALGLVVTYRSSGVVNFATGAIALYTAYTYAFLRRGALLLPIPGLPKTVSVGSHWGLWPALLVSLAIAALLGVLLYVLVFRWLRAAPPVAKAVASIGLLIVIQALLAQRVGTTPVSVKRILPSDSYTIGDLRIQGDKLWFALTIVVLALALAGVFRFTRFGLATRAAAETEKGALVTGLSPDRIALANWAIGAVVAGLSGILISPIVPLIPVSYTLFIVPALAAALVAGFNSLGLAVGAGLLIGMVQSELQYLQSQHSWLPQQGLGQLVPLVVILAYLVFRGRPLPTRGMLIRANLGQAPRPRHRLLNIVIPAAVAVVLLVATSGSMRAAVVTSMLLGIVTLSLVVVTGYAGQVSLAQLTLAGVGGFLVSRMTTDWNIPFPIAPLLAALGAMIIGVVVGLPALRIRGLPVAVVTLALGMAVESIWFRNPDVNGGTAGAKVADPKLWGLNLRIGAGENYPRIQFGLLCLMVLIGVALAVAELRRSRLGAAMLAVRANERSAAAAGIDVARVKIAAFAIGSFIAGLGGALMGYQQTLVDAESFSVVGGLALFATAYLAGITSVSGGLLAGVLGAGGLLFVALDKAVDLGSWYQVITGLALVLSVLLNPEGAVGPVHTWWAALRSKRLRAEPPVLPTADATAATTPAGEPVDAIAAAATAGAERIMLTLRGVGVQYGGVRAVQDVSLDFGQGQVVGLIGPNGAGKTTLIDAISGFTAATGEVEFEGIRLDGLKPHHRIRKGLGRTFQGIELYEDLSVAENVAVGEAAARGGGGRLPADHADYLDRLYRALQLHEVRESPVRELSQGHRQLVSIARALAGRPRVLLLDEPAGGLDSTESLWLGERLREVARTGVTIVLVDHDMNLVLGVCDRIVVLALGAVIASGSPEEIKNHPAVAEAYLGSTPVPPQPATPPGPSASMEKESVG
ncbi:branched-chain amino acid ABC transporter permease/ATP-binding protein [Frankia tisae]|uniref:branched-chain amino acid ABC transporter permease/ATP-binding protein n=1 Tax=Frankia tisae TaxID=2950104 RepID=UPI0021C07A83|nr:branched-chain amino acid ABC transporter permease/ATP-binding protein [Frankia tisae]